MLSSSIKIEHFLELWPVSPVFEAATTSFLGLGTGFGAVWAGVNLAVVLAFFEGTVISLSPVLT